MESLARDFEITLTDEKELTLEKEECEVKLLMGQEHEVTLLFEEQEPEVTVLSKLQESEITVLSEQQESEVTLLEEHEIIANRTMTDCPPLDFSISSPITPIPRTSANYNTEETRLLVNIGREIINAIRGENSEEARILLLSLCVGGHSNATRMDLERLIGRSISDREFTNAKNYRKFPGPEKPYPKRQRR